MSTLIDSSMNALVEFNRRLLENVLKPLAQSGGATSDTVDWVRALSMGLAQDSTRLADIQRRYYEELLALWSAQAAPAAGADTLKAVKPNPVDPRFSADEWRQPYFNFLTQSYLLTSRFLSELVDAAALEPHAKKKLRFFARQYIDAMSPANFAWSNPEALKLAAQTQGDSVARGLRNLATDMDRGLVSMTDETAFEVGRDLGITPGSVIFENELMQLIQYKPATGDVYTRPLVIVPPCINKFYILDLQPDNSFVRYAVSEGHTVFMVSWRNVPESMGKTTWDDYLTHGVMKALAVAQAISGTGKINALGFCVGGTLLGAALAVRRAQGDDSVASLTLLATMLDFVDTGELSVFVDPPYVQKRENDFAHGGVLPGRELALTFASLRANDLIWPYVVNNYLKGNTPAAFDLLYWNSDSTNLPGTMYTYYVRNMYLENNLCKPARLTMCKTPVDLRKIDMPAFVLATREDHIVPWKTAYASARHLRGKVCFVLAASGHIAGVINPAMRNRRNYWVGRKKLVKDAERWLSDARSEPGSWWGHWSAWLSEHSGERVPAPATLGNSVYREIEAAPGRYVKEKARQSAE